LCLACKLLVSGKRIAGAGDEVQDAFLLELIQKRRSLTLVAGDKYFPHLRYGHCAFPF
jgi:hypothetical protein